MMQGRFHAYEGYDLREVTLPVRVMKRLGVKTLIVTNASGGVNTSFTPGDLMLMTDFINLSGKNPLTGPNLDEFGPRFPDMSHAYDVRLQKLTRDVAAKLGIALREGVYCWMNGPTYESPAEIRMARILGGDAVGMSTVPETIVARHSGMDHQHGCGYSGSAPVPSGSHGDRRAGKGHLPRAGGRRDRRTVIFC